MLSTALSMTWESRDRPIEDYMVDVSSDRVLDAVVSISASSECLYVPWPAALLLDGVIRLLLDVFPVVWA